MRITKPRVIVNPVANRYTSADERIIEVVFEDGTGALISLKQPDQYPLHSDGRARIEVYRTDDKVRVLMPRSDVARQIRFDQKENA